MTLHLKTVLYPENYSLGQKKMLALRKNFQSSSASRHEVL